MIGTDDPIGQVRGPFAEFAVCVYEAAANTAAKGLAADDEWSFLELSSDEQANTLRGIFTEAGIATTLTGTAASWSWSVEEMACRELSAARPQPPSSETSAGPSCESPRAELVIVRRPTDAWERPGPPQLNLGCGCDSSEKSHPTVVSVPVTWPDECSRSRRALRHSAQLSELWSQARGTRRRRALPGGPSFLPLHCDAQHARLRAEAPGRGIGSCRRRHDPKQQRGG